MSGPGFYWFAAKDFPPAFRRCPTFAGENSTIKVQGQNPEDAHRQAQEIARNHAQPYMRWWERLSTFSIPKTPSRFEPFNIPKRKPRT